jgi:hypothetical protein
VTGPLVASSKESRCGDYTTAKLLYACLKQFAMFLAAHYNGEYFNRQFPGLWRVFGNHNFSSHDR